MAFRNPVTSLPGSAITGPVDLAYATQTGTAPPYWQLINDSDPKFPGGFLGYIGYLPRIDENDTGPTFGATDDGAGTKAVTIDTGADTGQPSASVTATKYGATTSIDVVAQNVSVLGLLDAQYPWAGLALVAGQALPASTVTTFQWQAPTTDTIGLTTTDHKAFTVPTPGLYLICAEIVIGPVSTNRTFAQITCPGHTFRSVITSDDHGLPFALVPLAAGDTLQVDGYRSGSSTTVSTGYLYVARLGSQ